MLASGYVPDRHNEGQFRDLARHAMRPEAHSADEALERLRDRGLRECGKTARGDASTSIERPAIEFVAAAGGAPPAPKVSPTVVKFSDGVFTVTTEIEVPRPYDQVSKFVGPKGWNALGPFWRAIDERWVESGDNRCDGDVYEHFVFSWNNVVENEYKVLLKATQRSKPGTMTRIDYSLVGEEHGRILVDEGYGLAVRDESRPGWTKYTGVKTLKFASSLLNLLSPAVMAMYLETQASGLQNAVLPR